MSDFKLPKKFECRYCGKQYAREASFEKHSCLISQIAKDKNIDDLKKIFEMFKFWYRYNGFSSSKMNRDNDLKKFIRSPYFKDFVNLYNAIDGIYMFNINDFIVWLCQNRIPSVKWNNQSTISAYKAEHNKRGSGFDQFSKTIENIALWCDIRNVDYKNFFEHVPKSEAVLWIQSGKLSPWYLLLSEKTTDLYSKMSDEELQNILQFIDMDYWDARFKVSQDEVDEIRKVIDDLQL